MKKNKDKKTKLVRIELEVANAVESHVLITKQSVGGFFALAATEKLQKEKK
jgi:hypothetical protein